MLKQRKIPADIRDKPYIGHEDVIGLNFIRADGPYFFRRYYRNGLRSHVMEVLLAADVKKETQGVVIDGVPRFPRARPLKMLRLFRRRFRHVEEVLDEIKRVKIIEQYLTPAQMAKSNEFVTEYRISGRQDTLLCGLQEFVPGEGLDPWHPVRLKEVPEIIRSMKNGPGAFPERTETELIRRFQNSVENFIRSIKTMILKADHIPDLAGEGNLLLTPSGGIKLVDINNISKVSFTKDIYLDDIGYPVCDKSIEALSLLERHLLGRPPDMTEAIYRHFLDPIRVQRVRDLDRSFHQTFNGNLSG